MTPVKMQVRDADLRGVLHRHGGAPGTDLYDLLRELQRRRDTAREAARRRRARTNGADRRSSTRAT